MSEAESRQVLATVFGDDWEMFLVAEGLVGGTTDADVLADRAAVEELAARLHPGLADEDVARVGAAWFQLWCVADPGGA